MTPDQAESTITISALVVGGIFAYRKLVEPGLPTPEQRTAEGLGGVRSQNLAQDYKSLFGAAAPISWSQWIKAAGFMYLSIAVIGAFSPDIGGALAVLIMTSAVIGNGTAIMADLKEAPESTRTEAIKKRELELGHTPNK